MKGLSQKEYPADIVLWPIVFTEANNDLSAMYTSLDDKAEKIERFLEKSGIEDAEITVSPPTITDKLAQHYGDAAKIKFRYTAQQAITVYSAKVERVREIFNQLADLGKQGIVFTEGDTAIPPSTYSPA